MLIGILSDTHDRVEITRVAITLLQERNAEMFLHCGDVGGFEVLDQLAGLRAGFVFGNNDWDREPLRRYAQGLNIECYGTEGNFKIEGKSIAIIHGDDARRRDRLLADQQHDYLLQGHTHQRADQRFDRVRLINPGALSRARQKSVATLDLATDLLSFIDVPDPGDGRRS